MTPMWGKKVVQSINVYTPNQLNYDSSSVKYILLPSFKCDHRWVNIWVHMPTLSTLAESSTRTNQ